MRTFILRAIVLTLGACLIPSAAAQTKPAPRISQVMPVGAKAGTTVELAVTGVDLE
jgi:hypothetical protein